MFALIVADLSVDAFLSVLTALVPTSRQVPESYLLWRGVAFGGSFVFLTLALAAIFKTLPDAKIAWRHVWIGAVLSAVLFLVGNHLIGLYIKWSGVGSAYGAAGSFVVILVWVYYSAQVLLFGLVFTKECAVSYFDSASQSQ